MLEREIHEDAVYSVFIARRKPLCSHISGCTPCSTAARKAQVSLAPMTGTLCAARAAVCSRKCSTPGNLEDLQDTAALVTCGMPLPGGSELENVQPLVARSFLGSVAVVHNGQM